MTPLLNAASAGSRYRPARLKAKKKRRKVGVRRVQSVPVSAQIVYGASDCVLCVRRYKCASRACSTSGRKSTKRARVWHQGHGGGTAAREGRRDPVRLCAAKSKANQNALFLADRFHGHVHGFSCRNDRGGVGFPGACCALNLFFLWRVRCRLACAGTAGHSTAVYCRDIFRFRYAFRKLSFCFETAVTRVVFAGTTASGGRRSTVLQVALHAIVVAHTP